jgi:hypothetical protein
MVNQHSFVSVIVIIYILLVWYSNHRFFLNTIFRKYKRG